MDISRYRKELEAIIPGALDAYQRLKTKNGMGIFTSKGAFYNHTFFGRDAAMTAKFVADFDHQAAKETIIALAALQGTKNDPKTQEQLGRIHHEFRDFKTWKGNLLERLLLIFFKRRWGSKGNQLLSYYSQDTTALYIRLIHKYTTHVDKSFLDQTVKNQYGQTVSIRESVAQAADWLGEQLDERYHLNTKRSNEWALPFQTFQDSSTAYPRLDGSLANFRRGITFTENQSFAVDALQDAVKLLHNHDHRHEWQANANAMRSALMKDFWNENEQFFASGYDRNGLIDMPNISAGWTLNTSLWDELNESKKVEHITAIVKRLFSDDFMTPVGLRTRSLHAPQPLQGVIEYHGRLTVWPMFNFMVIEGLRHHRLYSLARELENRVINGINASGKFEEFLVVDGGGHMLKSVPGKHAEVKVDAQMLPEENIAFTVIPSIVLAWRGTNRGNSMPSSLAWQKELEDKVMKTIEPTERLSPDEAHETLNAVVPTKFRRIRGNVRSTIYFLKERKRM